MMSTRSHSRSRQEGCWRNTRGFTLVELLVVVSIIALLIAILLPSLKKAREQAKSVVCMGNLRGIGQAFTMYGESFDGLWPPTVDSTSQNRWPVPFHKGGIIHAKYATFEDSSPYRQITSADDSIFICPSERAPRVIPDYIGNGSPRPVDRVEIGGSYAMNDENRRDPNGKLANALLPGAFLNRIDNCRRVAEVFAVMDHYQPLDDKPGTQGWRFNRGTNGDPSKSGRLTAQQSAFWAGWRDRETGEPISKPDEYTKKSRTIGVPHGDMGNGMCVDSHAERFNPLKVRYDQISWTRWPRPDEKPFGGF